MKKTLIILSSLIIVVSVALFLFIQFYITPERVKEFVVPTVESSLSRKINIGEIDINVFKGIGLNDFAIKEADGKTDFVTCKNFVLKFKLLPLLSRQVIIDELTIVSPEIRVIRNKEGIFNYEGIGKATPADEGPGTTQEHEQTETDQTEGLPVSLLVSRVNIEKAQFSLTDHMNELPDIRSSLNVDLGIESITASELSTSGSIKLVLDEIVLKEGSRKRIEEITTALDYSVRVNLNTFAIAIEQADLSLMDIPLSITGTVTETTSSPVLDLSVRVPHMDTSEALELASSFIDLKGIALSGSLSTDLKIKGRVDDIQALQTDGQIDMKNIAFSDGTIGTTAGGSIAFKTNADNLEIKKADLNVQDILFSLKGSVSTLSTTPILDISLSLPETDAEKLLELASSFTDLEDLKLTGGVKADITVRGDPAQPEKLKPEGTISLNKLRISQKEIDALLNGTAVMVKSRLDIDMTGAVGRNSASLKASVKNYMKDQDITLNIYSRKLYLDEIIPVGPSEPEQPKTAQTGKASDKELKEPAPLDLKLTVAGEIRVDSAIYQGLDMKDFRMKFSLRNNTLQISPMSAAVGKGTVNMNALLELGKPGYAYSASAGIKEVHANEIVSPLFPDAKDTLFGALSLDLKLNGKGTIPENIKKHLKADGTFNFKDGKITNTKLATNLALLLGLDEFETIEIQKAEGTVRVKKGTAQLKSIFSSGDFSLDPSGNIGLDETLDLAFDLKLSPSLTSKAMKRSGIARYIKNEKGEGVIPLIVSGTFSEPSYTVDLEKAGKRAIKREADKFLDKLFKKGEDKGKQEEPVGEQEQDPVKQLEKPLKDLFKGLF